MKFSVLLIVALVASTIAAPLQSSPSICDAYTGVLNGKAVVDAIVSGTVTLIAGSNLARFFDGSIAGTTNFIGNATALGILGDHLTQFFGSAGLLNCTDGTIPPYAGNPNMQQVHAKLPIALADSILFNKLLLQSAGTVGVNAVDAEKVRVMLNSVRYDICNTGSTCNPGSFCDKYSVALNFTNNELVSAVVGVTVTDITAVGNSLRRFFDGSIAGTTDFLTNAVAFKTLSDHLVQFFGDKTVLDCTDLSIGAYAGKSMLAAHAKLPIALADFNNFNAAVIKTMTNFGVAKVDTDAVLVVLESTKKDICNQPDCNNSASGIFYSAFLLFAAFLVTLF